MRQPLQQAEALLQQARTMYNGSLLALVESVTAPFRLDKKHVHMVRSMRTEALAIDRLVVELGYDWAIASPGVECLARRIVSINEVLHGTPWRMAELGEELPGEDGFLGSIAARKDQVQMYKIHRAARKDGGDDEEL